MLYRSLLRPLAFQLDAERAHELTLAGLRGFSRMPLLSRSLHALTSVRGAAVSVAGLSFPNRVGLAGGLDKNAFAVPAWWALGFGFVELGTVTPKPQAGNEKPRLRRLVERRAILNRMGFNNDGADAIAERLRVLRRPAFPIGVSIGKQATTPVGDLAAVASDYAECAAKLGPHADFLSVNVSSPNTSGLRSLQTAEAMKTIVRAASVGRPVFVKLAPELEGDELTAVVAAALDSGATGLIATNTLGATMDGKPCGLSGTPLRAISPRRIEAMRKHVGDGVPLIGVGGIDGVASARAMIAAGADLIQLYTALVYEGPFLAARIARGLQ